MNMRVGILAAVVLILCVGLPLGGQEGGGAVDADLAIANGYDDAWGSGWPTCGRSTSGRRTRRPVS